MKTKWKSSKLKWSSPASKAAITVFQEVSWQVGRRNMEVLGKRWKSSFKDEVKGAWQSGGKTNDLLRDTTQRFWAFGQNQSSNIKKTQSNKNKNKRGGKGHLCKNNAKIPCCSQNIKKKNHNGLYLKEKADIFWRQQRSSTFASSHSFINSFNIFSGFSKGSTPE